MPARGVARQQRRGGRYTLSLTGGGEMRHFAALTLKMLQTFI
jgi:hypothetical protein